MKDILTTKEAAEYIRHSETTLEQWRMQDKGPVYIKPESKVFYRKSDLDDWLNEVTE